MVDLTGEGNIDTMRRFCVITAINPVLTCCVLCDRERAGSTKVNFTSFALYVCRSLDIHGFIQIAM